MAPGFEGGTVNALDTMRALAAKREVREAQAGEVIFAAGESGASMFGLLEGTVRLCLLYTSPSPRDGLLSRMPSSA